MGISIQLWLPGFLSPEEEKRLRSLPPAYVKLAHFLFLPPRSMDSDHGLDDQMKKIWHWHKTLEIPKYHQPPSKEEIAMKWCQLLDLAPHQKSFFSKEEIIMALCRFPKKINEDR